MNYDVYSIVNGRELPAGSVVETPGKGFRFVPNYPGKPSSKYHSTPQAAVSGRLKNYRLVARQQAGRPPRQHPLGRV